MALVMLPAGNPPPVHAISAFFSVTDTGDGPDANAGDGLCATAGGACTLRAAIQEANANGNPSEIDVIAFGNTAGGPGSVMNIRPLTPLPTITQAVSLSGQNASGSSCDAPRTLLVSIEPGGPMPGGIGIRATGTSNVSLSGIQLGGFAAAGVFIEGGSSHTIFCTNIGTDLAGTTARVNGIGVALAGASSVTIGHSGVAISNIISGNGHGVGIASGSSSVTLRANRIGVGADGAALGNLGSGVLIQQAEVVSIGVRQAGGGNVIAANGGNGITVDAGNGDISSVLVYNNFVGYAPDGTTPMPNGSHGIAISAPALGTVDNVTIGDFDVNAPNRIYASGTNHAVLARAVEDSSTVSHVLIRGNRLVSETGIAINLRPFDEAANTPITPNDFVEEDADFGPNTLLNFPNLLTATSEQFPKFDFSYRTEADKNISIAFYAVDACGPGTNRVVHRWLGSTAYTSGPDGVVTGPTGVSSALAVGEGVAAIVTDELGNSSEISNCVTATLPPPDLDAPEPRFAVAGQQGFTLELASSIGPFAPGSKVTWGGEELITTATDDFHRSAFITAEQVGDSARTVQVGVTGAGTVPFPVVRSSSDVDCTGTVTASDSLLLLSFLAGLVNGATLSGCDLPPFPLGDANQSNATDLADVLHIRRELADLEQPLAGELPQKN